MRDSPQNHVQLEQNDHLYTAQMNPEFPLLLYWFLNVIPMA